MSRFPHRLLFATAALGLALASAASGQNDNFANALEITSVPYQSYQGSSGTAEAGEPAHAGSPAASSFWYQWQPGSAATCAFGEYLSSSTRIAIYTGTQLNNLTLVAQGLQRAFFQASPGVRYFIAVDSPGPKVVYLRRYPDGGADAIENADVIPVSLPQQVHGNNLFATTAADDAVINGSTPAHTVWWRWAPANSGLARIDTRLSDFGPDVAIYEKTLLGTPTLVATGRNSAAFTATAGNTYFIRLSDSAYGAGEINFWLDWMPEGVPANDNISNATDLGTTSLACSGAWILRATPEALPDESPSMYGLPGDRTVWWRWTCPTTGYYRISTHGSDYSPTLNVYTGSPNGLNLVANAPVHTPDGVRILASAATTYWIQLNDKGKICSRVELNIHPAASESDYFRSLSQRNIRLRGDQRHPQADPDNDGFSNLLELACQGDPENPGPTANLPHLSIYNNQRILRWMPDTLFLSRGATPPVLRAESSTTLASPWTTETPTGQPGTSYQFFYLPNAARAFGRLSVEDTALAPY